MPVNNLYYNKYLKYKNKYLNLQSQIGGVHPSDSVSLIKKQHSQVITCQGTEGTCWAHSTTRLISKLLKNIFNSHFLSDIIENCSYYYDTIKCNNNINNIFDCFLYIKRYKSICKGRHINDWLDENLSALLFHFIFKILIDQYGRKDGVYEPSVSCLYILDYLKYIDINEDLIKTTLAYKNEIYTDEDNVYFMTLITKLVNIFRDVKDNLNTKKFNPMCYIILYEPGKENIKVYSIIKYSYFTQSFKFDGDNCVPIIPEEISFLDKHKEKIPFSSKLINLNPEISNNHHLKNIIGTNDLLPTLKYILKKGFYALFTTGDHVIVITDYNDSDDDDIILNVKNSWGKNSCDILQKDWCDLLEYNKISMNKLLKWDKNFNIVFFYPIDYTYISIFNENNLSNKDVTAFLHLLNNTEDNSKLTNLKINNSKFEINNFNTLNEILKKNINLEELDLGFNNIGNYEINFLFPSQNITLKTLNLSNNNIVYDGVNIIAEILKINTTLLVLDMNNNIIGDEGAKLIAESLKINTTLLNLEMTNNIIGTEGAKLIAELLKRNTTLKILNLSNNNIGDEGAKLIAESLKINTTLLVLDMNNNIIGDEGAKLIAESLKINTTLKILNLSNNNIGDEGAMSLATAKEQHNIEINIDLTSNRISLEVIAKIFTKQINISLF